MESNQRQEPPTNQTASDTTAPGIEWERSHNPDASEEQVRLLHSLRPQITLFLASDRGRTEPMKRDNRNKRGGNVLVPAKKKGANH